MADAAMIVSGDDGAIAVAEGPVDALALGWWLGVEAWAAGGRAMDRLVPRIRKTGRPVEIHADGGAPGRAAAFQLCWVLWKGGCTARVIDYPDGQDPASYLPAHGAPP